jgi:hypothetical protein
VGRERRVLASVVVGVSCDCSSYARVDHVLTTVMVVVGLVGTVVVAWLRWRRRDDPGAGPAVADDAAADRATDPAADRAG